MARAHHRKTHVPVTAALRRWQHSGRSARGGLKLLRYIGEGACARVYIGRLGRLGHNAAVVVVKRMRRSSIDVHAMYSWRAAGLHSPPTAQQRGAVLQYAHVRAVMDADDSDASDSEEEAGGSAACVRVPVAWTVAEHARDGATALWRSGTFLTEAAVATCLQQHVQRHLPAPVFCRQRDAWQTRTHAYIAMEWAGQALEDLLPTLDLPDVQAIVLQVLVALAWAQDKVHFKHHDLHTGNVFARRPGAAAPLPRDWTAPSGTVFQLPSVRWHAVIADYGLSAATDPRSRVRFSRADYCLMDVDEDKWGDWTNALHEYEAYDVIVLLASMLDCRGMAKPVRTWLKRVYDAIKELDPHVRVSRDLGRPFGSARKATPRALLQHAVFAAFRT